VLLRRITRKITVARVASTIVLLAVIYLLLIITFDILQYLPYFRFFLLCIAGAAFLVITYLLKQ
jgi:hypothetical protein